MGTDEEKMADPAMPEAAFALSGSRGFAAWLAGTGGSLALTTYQAGKLLLLGSEADGAVSLFEREFTRPMGLAVAAGGRGFMLATQHQIYRFDDALPAGGADERGFDAAFVPHVGWVTGSVDAHDVGIGMDGRPVFVSSLYSCIAAVSDSHSFRALWRPPFVSALAPEDRCHLNGMAMADGRPLYATAVASTDARDGWRDRRADGGVVIDVQRDEIVAEGLAMPHSPRLHDGRLWLLNSGAGEFGFVDLAAGRFEAVAFCPGYARGLAFAGNQAIAGLSRPRENEAFAGLPLDEALAAHGSAPRCGLAVIDLASGDTVEWAEIEGGINELYDVAFLPGVRRPSAVGFKTDEIKQRISIER
jgi:uncharacterized protein (TIGR03032 family)